MKLLLQHKMVAGYLLLMAVIGCMVAIVLHECKRVVEIEQESVNIYLDSKILVLLIVILPCLRPLRSRYDVER